MRLYPARPAPTDFSCLLVRLAFRELGSRFAPLGVVVAALVGCGDPASDPRADTPIDAADASDAADAETPHQGGGLPDDAGTPPEAGSPPTDADADANTPANDAQARCERRASSRCVGSEVYWFSSCNEREELKESCRAGYTCEQNACRMQTLGSAALVTEIGRGGSSYCKLYASGNDVYWATDSWLARSTPGGEAGVVWDRHSRHLGNYGFFVSGNDVFFGRNTITRRSLATGAETKALDCNGHTLTTSGATAYYDCDGAFFASPIASFGAASARRLGSFPNEIWLGDTYADGGALHFRVHDRERNVVRFCTIPERGGDAVCNPTVSAGTGREADCYHNSGTWAGSGGTFFCFGRTETGAALKTFGTTGAARVIATDVNSDGYSRLLVRDGFLYFPSRTADWNVYALARMRFDGTQRTFVASQPMYGVGDVAVVGSTLYWCGVHEGVNLTARLYRLQR
jgi:hypothetical protein